MKFIDTKKGNVLFILALLWVSWILLGGPGLAVAAIVILMRGDK